MVWGSDVDELTTLLVQLATKLLLIYNYAHNVHLSISPKFWGSVIRRLTYNFAK